MCPACPRAAGGAWAERWKFLRSPLAAGTAAVIAIDGAAQIAQLRRTVTKKGKKTPGSPASPPGTATRTLPPWPPGSAATGR